MIFHSIPELLFRVLPSKIRQETVLKCLDRVTKAINKLPSVFTIWVNTHISLSTDRIYTVLYIQANLLQGQFSSVQSLSHVQLFVTPCTTACQVSLSVTNSQSLLKLMFIKSVMPFNHLILCHPLLLLSSIFPSIRVNESVLPIRWPKYWSFNFSISPSSEYSWLISFRVDWLDLLAVQGTLKSLLQHHSSKALILWCSDFFVLQLSHPYMTTGKSMALIRWTFVGKVICLLFNMLSSLVIAYLPRSKHLLISGLQSPSTVISEPKGIKSLTVSIVSPSICYKVMGPDVMALVFWMLSLIQLFHSPLSLSSRGSLVLLHFLP